MVVIIIIIVMILVHLCFYVALFFSSVFKIFFRLLFFISLNAISLHSFACCFSLSFFSEKGLEKEAFFSCSSSSLLLFLFSFVHSAKNTQKVSSSSKYEIFLLQSTTFLSSSFNSHLFFYSCFFCGDESANLFGGNSSFFLLLFRLRVDQKILCLSNTLFCFILFHFFLSLRTPFFLFSSSALVFFSLSVLLSKI